MTGQPLGPFETSSDAMLALRPADGSFIDSEALSELLKNSLQTAGVELGEWDWQIVRWLAGLDVQTVAAIAGWLQRAPVSSAEDARRLGEVRVVLARFDWEHDDRQLALEAIERIVDGGQT